MNLFDSIKINYSLDIISIVKNDESSDGNVYNIKTSDDKYILKIYDDLDKANNMIDIHNYLKNLYVPRIILTKNNEYLFEFDNKYVIIYSFLAGMKVSELIRNNLYSNDIVISIAKEVRKLHDLTLNKKFNFKTIDFANNLKRKSVLHFDLTKDNIFTNNNHIGFIDFDDAKYGDSVCDIAILLSFLFISKKRGVDNEGIKLFLDNYYNESEIQLRNEETFYIKKYIKCWIDYLLDDHNFDSSLKDSFEFKRASADKLDI